MIGSKAAGENEVLIWEATLVDGLVPDAKSNHVVTGPIEDAIEDAVKNAVKNTVKNAVAEAVAEAVAYIVPPTGFAGSAG